MKTAKPKPCPKKRLPNKPSALIKLALADLAVVERRKGYVIDMGEYHRPEPDLLRSEDVLTTNRKRTCHVCLAGCVIANTLRFPTDSWLIPSSSRLTPEFSATNDRKLIALDKFRAGDLREGLELLGLGACDWDGLPERFLIAEYEADRKQFRKDLRDLIKLLEEHGL